MMKTEGLTEDDIARYLADTPGFFERNAELLASIQLTSPHGLRAVSLQERQMEMLREKNKGLERRIADMIRHGQENMASADRLHRWTRALLLAQQPAERPAVLLRELQGQFLIPQAGVRVWRVQEAHRGLPCAQPVGEDLKSFANSLALPYCGVNSGFEAVQWLDDPGCVMSLALIPLRLAVQAPAFGLLVLASPDPTRYAADMGTDFLLRIGDLAAAALSPLLAA